MSISSTILTLQEAKSGEIFLIYKQGKKLEYFFMPYLIVKKGELEGQTIPLQNEKTTFGRAENSDVCLKDINISRRHAQILRLNNNVMAIVDLGSSNGTYVNDFPINRIFLMDGDEIRMGETVMTYCEGELEERRPSKPLILDKEKPISAIPATHATRVMPPTGEQIPLDSLKEAYLHLRTLYKITSDMNSARDLSELYQRVGGAMQMSIGADRVAFFKLEGVADRLELQSVSLIPSSQTNQSLKEQPFHQQVLNCIQEEKAPFLFTEEEAAGEGEPRATVMGVPILREGKLTGIIYVDSPLTERTLNKTDLDFAAAVALQMGTAEERMQNLRQLSEKNSQLERVINENLTIVCRNQKMLEIMDILNQLAESDSNVLIRGESGTGKELIARAIHFYSRRREHPLICLNCASLPETLIESELFGYERGAFTGAVSRKPGKFELADGGTLFLDEIGDISLSAQAKILRALQDGEIQRVGGTTTLRVDVRLIAATNKDLMRAIQSNQFRDDLYYRIKVVEIEIPPLRERKEDIPILAEYFLKILRGKTASRAVRFSPETMHILVEYPWHGNVRELRNVVERALVFCRGDEIFPHHLPAELKHGEKTQAASPDATPTTLNEMERLHIIKTLQHVSGNKLKAAELLGISRSTLYEKMKQYGIIT